VLYVLNLNLEKIGLVKGKLVTKNGQPNLLASFGVFFNYGVEHGC